MSGFHNSQSLRRIPVELSDKTIIYVEVEAIGDQPVSSSKASIKGVMQKLESLAKDLGDSVKQISDVACPDEISIEMGLEASLETGKLSAILVQGGSKANFKVTMKWNLER